MYSLRLLRPSGKRCNHTPNNPTKGECMDIANFAMMIFDKLGGGEA